MPLNKPSLILLSACLLSLQPAWAGNGMAASSSTTPKLKISYTLDLPGSNAESDGDSSDLWSSIREGFRLKDVNPALTRVYEKWYTEHSRYLDQAIQRSRLYLYHIAEEVRKRDMPMEIALLPIIESAYNPMAQSSSKASGIWQFIPSTGRTYGLEQNAWYDGRRDVLAATRAALDYLQDLHNQFGSWDLALAAYNCGEGCVARAIARNRARGRPVNYAHLRLPAQTRHYVPKLIAIRNIIEDPQRYGFVLNDLANEPYFMQVSLTFPMAARQAAKLADMNLHEFMALNPAYQRRVIYSDTPGILLLPADKVLTFHLNLHRLGAKKLSLQTYKARRGESLRHIAAKFDVTLKWIKDHNPVRLYRGRLTRSQTLYVPRLASKTDHSRHEKDKKEGTLTLRAQGFQAGHAHGNSAGLYDVDASAIRPYHGTVIPLRPALKLTIPNYNS